MRTCPPSSQPPSGSSRRRG